MILVGNVMHSARATALHRLETHHHCCWHLSVSVQRNSCRSCCHLDYKHNRLCLKCIIDFKHLTETQHTNANDYLTGRLKTNTKNIIQTEVDTKKQGSDTKYAG